MPHSSCLKAQSLTPRERRVVELAAQGLTNLRIADAMGLSVTSVIGCWRRIRNKIDRSDIREAIAEALRRIQAS